LPINTATGTPGTAIDGAGEHPAAIALTPDGQTAYVADQGSGSGGNGNVTPIDLGEELHWIAIAPDSGTAYVTNFLGTKVTPIDLTDGKAGTSVVGSDLGAIAIAPDQAPQPRRRQQGRLSGTPLGLAQAHAGRYTLSITATTATGTSRPVSLRFTIAG
jgi:hypothetical protein